MKLRRKLRILSVAGIAASSLTMGLVTLSSSGASAANPHVLTWAEAPQAPPNYIFPYMGFSYFSVANINQFQELMYRPMYWFGQGGSVAYQPSLSLADSPKWSNGYKTLTINLKGWKFADGQTVNAQSVMFFLNLYKADPTSYAGYAPGYGIPDQVKTASGHGNTVTLKFTSSISPNWLLYNYLSEISPMPDAWDITAPGKTSTCATGAYGAKSTDTACKAVEKYLDAQATKTSTYTDAMWKAGTDGPWLLKSFDSLGNVTFVPNTAYSGPQKAQVSQFVEVPFTSNQAELNALLSGRLDLGYVDTTQLTQPAKSPTQAGPNLSALAGKYNIVTGPSWSYNYDPVNFNKATNPIATVMAKLYFRKALQLSTNQQGIINKVDRGYGAPQWSPLPNGAPSSVSTTPKNPYPFNMKKAKNILTSHGWAEQGGVMTCVRPGQNRPGGKMGKCGKNVAKGTKLKMLMESVSGSQSLTEVVNSEIANWKTLGIQVTNKVDTFDNVISGCSQTSHLKWTICTWGAGWIYAPDYYPSGEELLLKGAGSNAGGYAQPKMDALIKATTNENVNLSAYEKLAAKKVPVIFQPTATGAGEYLKTLKSSIGFQPSPLQNLMPEYIKF